MSMCSSTSSASSDSHHTSATPSHGGSVPGRRPSARWLDHPRGATGCSAITEPDLVGRVVFVRPDPVEISQRQPGLATGYVPESIMHGITADRQANLAPPTRVGRLLH